MSTVRTVETIQMTTYSYPCGITYSFIRLDKGAESHTYQIKAGGERREIPRLERALETWAALMTQKCELESWEIDDMIIEAFPKARIHYEDGEYGYAPSIRF